MNSNSLTSEIRAHFDSINRLAKKSVNNFEREVLSEFRIAVQKLRAFLHLLSTDTDAEDSFRIRRRLKSFYGYTGIIRNLELQINLVTILTPEGSSSLDPYLDALKRDRDGWRDEAVSMLTDHDDFNEEREIVLKSLPGQLSRATVRKFVTQSSVTLARLIQSSGEHDLHELRKVMKDLLFNWRWLENECEELLPNGLASRDNLTELTGLLGMYGEKCAALDLLKPAYCGQVCEGMGTTLLTVLREQIERRKAELRTEFLDSLFECTKSAKAAIT